MESFLTGGGISCAISALPQKKKYGKEIINPVIGFSLDLEFFK